MLLEFMHGENPVDMVYIQANFVEGQEKITKLLRAIWLRKKMQRERLEKDKSERI